MTLTLSYENKRDLLTGMLYKRSNTQVASRSYTYDTLGRPTFCGTTRDGQSVSDSFAYNNRSELATATVSGESYAYDYDNIGNRETAQEAAETVTAYATNSLNQYTAIGDFVPTFDDAGNQTLVKTSSGIWAVTYDAENRPTLFSNADSSTTVECTYDYMGRRATKKVTVNGSVTLHQRYIYRGYLQIASCDLTRTAQTALWLLTWDPTQTTATRPLAIQINGTWFTYGWDLTKNICEVYGQHGYIRTAYTYTPYGSVTMSGDFIQPIQWSSEYHDTELALVYYNYRHYNPTDGRWLGRDFISNKTPYLYVLSRTINCYDVVGLYEYGVRDFAIDTASAILIFIDVITVPSGEGLVPAGILQAYKETARQAARHAAKESARLVVLQAAEEANIQAEREARKKKKERCNELQKIKSEAKQAARGKGCAKIIVPVTVSINDCLKFKNYAQLWKNERIARENYDKECFDGGNDGHKKQTEQKNGAENNCMEKYRECLNICNRYDRGAFEEK